MPVEADHVTMCHFESAEDGNFEFVHDWIEQATGIKSTATIAKATPSPKNTDTSEDISENTNDNVVVKASRDTRGLKATQGTLGSRQGDTLLGEVTVTETTTTKQRQLHIRVASPVEGRVTAAKGPERPALMGEEEALPSSLQDNVRQRSTRTLLTRWYAHH